MRARTTVITLRAFLRVRDGVIGRRRLRETGEHRALGEVELLGRFAKVGAAGFLEAVGTVTVVNGIQIELEDLFLAVIPPSWMASASSSILRVMVRSLERKMFFTVCWVMVPPPWSVSPAR